MAQITVKQAGDYIYVRQPGYTDTYDLIRRIEIVEPEAAVGGHGTVDFMGMIRCLSTETDDPDVIYGNAALADILNSTNDNTPPIRINNTYLGGSHFIRNFVLTKASHGLTNTDVGDVGTDGAAKEWVIIEIVDADNIRVSPQNTGTLTEWVINGNITGDTITFTGAGAYTFTDTVSGVPPYPFVQDYTRSFRLDGEAIADLSTAQTGSYFEILEDYGVPNCGAILADLISNKPDATPLAVNDSSIQTQVQISMNWRFDRFCGRTGTYTLHNETDYVIGSDDYFGAMQFNACYRFNLDDNGKWLMYVPDVDPVDGYDFKSKADITVSPGVTISLTDCEDTDNPPGHWAQIVAQTDETPVFGFVNGYRRNFGVGTPSERARLCDRLFNFSTSEKMYPAFISDAVQPDGGEIYSVQTYDAFYDMGDNPDYTVNGLVEFSDGKIHWIFDCHTTLSNQWIALPSELEGYRVAIVDQSSSFTLESGSVVQESGVQVSVADDYGHAILELTENKLNDIYLWRGAVEPAESSPSGNQVAAWRGAVEPVYVEPAASVTNVAGGHISRRKPRYIVEVDGQNLVANSISDVEAILAAARETAPEAAERDTQDVVRKPPRVTVKTGAGKPTTSKTIKQEVDRTREVIRKAYKAAAKRRQQQAEVDREISQRMQEKLRREEEDDSITVLLLS